LIIFDLDDTLIDTSGSLTPQRLEAAFERMIEAGLSVPDRSAALEFLKRLNETAESARAALSEFIELVDGDERLYSLGVAEIYDVFPEDSVVFPLEDALAVLEEVRQMHRLALVTLGKESHQLLKLKKAGIDSTIFSKIVVSEDRDKKPHYIKILKEMGYAPQETVVCGDRIGVDLTPAKELGCRTVHMQWGRGSGLKSTSRDVDFTITELKKIPDILAKL